MRKVRRFKITDIFIGILFTLFFVSAGVIITINFRPLYYMDINLLDISEASGYSREEIRENYDALIDYSSPFFRGKLSFPTLTSSEAGLQHFKEVKNIFMSFYVLAALSLISLVFIIIGKGRKKEFSYLAVSSLTAVLLPAVLGLLLALDFDTSFVIFHKLFFNNDYWLFDPVTDPVIQILPDTFFLHCALMIIGIVILCSIILYITYLILKRRSGIKYRKIRGINI